MQCPTSWKKTATLTIVVEVESLVSSWKKITTRRREGVGIVVEKNEEIQQKFVIYLQQ